MMIHRTVSRLAALVVFATCLAAQAGTVVINHAEYGFNKIVKNNKNRKVHIDERVNITQIVHQWVITKTVVDNLKSMDDTFGDPSPGRQKSLNILYSVNGKDETLSLGENQLPEFIEWIHKMRKINKVE